MARYLMLAPAFLHAIGDSSPRLHAAHTEVQFSGPPSAGMVALDADARAAKERAALLHRHPDAARRDALVERRLRARLSKTLAVRLANAEAEMTEADRA